MADIVFHYSKCIRIFTKSLKKFDNAMLRATNNNRLSGSESLFYFQAGTTFQCLPISLFFDFKSIFLCVTNYQINTGDLHTPFYALVNEVMKRLKSESNIKEEKWLNSEEAMAKLRILSKTTLRCLRNEGCIVTLGLLPKTCQKIGTYYCLVVRYGA